MIWFAYQLSFQIRIIGDDRHRNALGRLVLIRWRIVRCVVSRIGCTERLAQCRKMTSLSTAVFKFELTHRHGPRLVVADSLEHGQNPVFEEQDETCTVLEIVEPSVDIADPD